MRLNSTRFSMVWLIVFLVGLSHADRLVAQEPSASLKQADADYREGTAALNRNDLKTASAKFEAVIHLAPGAEQGHSALGAVLVREGQLADGIRELQKALSILPTDSTAQTNLVLAYQQTGELAKELPLLAKLDAKAKSEKHHLSPPMLISYARALASTGQSGAAVARLKEALAQQPQSAQLHDEIGSLYALQKNWDHAEQEFAEAIRLKPDFAMAHLRLGFVLQAEQKSRAANEWSQAYSLAPEDAQVALAVGEAFANAGQDEQALPILQRAHELAPGSIDASYQLALVLQRTNRMQDSIPLLKAVVEAQPKNADALINLGLAISQAHQARDAVPYLQKAIALKPDNVTAHQNLAAAYLQINEVGDAVVELQAALRLTPDSPQLHYNLGLAYKLEDDAEHAIPELEAAEKLDANAYEPAYVLGVLYMQLARYEEAARQLENSLKLHPDNGEGWATLGNVYNKLERLPEAVSALREAVRQLPNQSDAHLTLAAVLVKQNQPAEAAAERKIAADLMRTHMNLQRAEVATNAGKSLMANGKLDDAIVQFRDALTFDPKYIEAHAELASALEKQGKTAEAAAERELAKSLGGSAN